MCEFARRKVILFQVTLCNLNRSVRERQNRWRSVLLERDSCIKKYDELKLVNLVQINEILLIENFTYLSIRLEMFGWIYTIYIYIDRNLAFNNLRGLICDKTQPKPNHLYLIYMYKGDLALTNKGWYAIKSKPNQTKSYILNIYIYIKGIWHKITYKGWYIIKIQPTICNYCRLWCNDILMLSSKREWRILICIL